jgi:hypothetical protein
MGVLAAVGAVAGVGALVWPLAARMARLRRDRRIRDELNAAPLGAPRNREEDGYGDG